MRTHGVDWQMTVYGGAVHSFTDVGAGSDVKTGAAYNQKADSTTTAVFNAVSGSSADVMQWGPCNPY